MGCIQTISTFGHQIRQDFEDDHWIVAGWEWVSSNAALPE